MIERFKTVSTISMSWETPCVAYGCSSVIALRGVLVMLLFANGWPRRRPKTTIDLTWAKALGATSKARSFPTLPRRMDDCTPGAQPGIAKNLKTLIGI